MDYFYGMFTRGYHQFSCNVNQPRKEKKIPPLTILKRKLNIYTPNRLNTIRSSLCDWRNRF